MCILNPCEQRVVIGKAAVTSVAGVGICVGPGPDAAVGEGPQGTLVAWTLVSEVLKRQGKVSSNQRNLTHAFISGRVFFEGRLSPLPQNECGILKSQITIWSESGASGATRGGDPGC